MAASSLEDEDGITGINVTPLVDIILVLLVIFMVTTTTIQNLEAVEVDKPDAKTGRNVDDLPTSIVLLCKADGTLIVDGEPITDRLELAAAIQAKAAANPDVQGIVQCDEKAEVGAMVELIDLLRDNGVRRYAIATEQPKPEAGPRG